MRIETILKMEPCNGGMLVVADQGIFAKASITVSEVWLPMPSWNNKLG